MFNLYQKFRLMWMTMFNLMFVVVANIITLPFRFKSKFKGSGNIHILGNGPSLKTDYERLKQSIKEGDTFLCVNGFATSDLFKDLRPNVYMVVDECFFYDGDMPEYSKSMARKTFQILQDEVDWDMNLIVPVNRCKSKKLGLVRNNINIKVNTFLNIPVVGGFIAFNAWLFFLRIATPFYQNVLVAAVYIAISSGFKNIFIWGGDHDWLEDRTVLSDNRMYVKESHFYENNESYTPCLNTSVYNEMECFGRCFRAYHELAKYAKLKKTKILNMSSKSWIDAFQRA